MSLTNYTLSEEEQREVYEWVDNFSLSRPKRNISRDFSDGILLAEVLKQYYPHMVQLHSLSSVNSKKNKLSNWEFIDSEVTRPHLQEDRLQDAQEGA